MIPNQVRNQLTGVEANLPVRAINVTTDQAIDVFGGNSICRYIQYHANCSYFSTQCEYSKQSTNNGVTSSLQIRCFIQGQRHNCYIQYNGQRFTEYCTFL